MTYRRLVITTLLIAIASSSAQAVEPPGHLQRLSHDIAVRLALAQKALLRKDWDEALAQIQNARELPYKTAADERVINKMFYGVIKSRAIADRITWEQATGATQP